MDRCYAEYVKKTESMSNGERVSFKAELEAWREEYRVLCAQDVVDKGDRFKVERKLIAQLNDIVRSLCMRRVVLT